MTYKKSLIVVMDRHLKTFVVKKMFNKGHTQKCYTDSIRKPQNKFKKNHIIYYNFIIY